MSRYALVVAVGQYIRDRNLSHLPAAYTDMREITKTLRERGEFQVQTLQDPVSADLKRAMEDLFSSRTTGDTVLMYFSGHGLTDIDKSRLYLAAKDTEEARLDSSAVEAELLQRLARESHAQTKMLLLDCCFAGMAGNGLRARSGRKVPLAQLNKHGTTILASSDQTQPSFEDSTVDNNPALFTAAVLDGLNGEAKDGDGDGWISMQDLASYVQQAEKLRDRQTPQYFAAGVTGDLALVRSTRQPAAVSDAPTLVTAGDVSEPTQDPAAPLDAATWRNLLEYYLACLRRESDLAGWIPLRQEQRFQTWPQPEECLFTGNGEPRQLPDKLRAFVAKNSNDNIKFYYGYPTVIVAQGRQGKLAPLVTAELTLSSTGEVSVATVQLNELVLDAFELDPPEIKQLCQHFAANFRHGNPEQFTRQLEQIAGSLEVPTTEDLDPSALSSHLKTTPLATGIQNLGIVYYTDDSGLATSNLIKDLRHNLLDKIPHFSDTALGAMAQSGTNPATGHWDLVAAGQLNESQEAVIDSAMTQRLTVATGPPGTGKTALVTALVATTTANNQTILVGSTNNEAVSGVHDKANTVAPGMLIRTGNKDVLAEEPATLNELLANVTPPQSTSVHGGRLREDTRQIAALRDTLDRRRSHEVNLLTTMEEIERVKNSPGASSLTELTQLSDKQLRTTAAHSRGSLRRWPFGTLPRLWMRWKMQVNTVDLRQALTELSELELGRRELTTWLAELPPETETWQELKTVLDRRIRNSQLLASQHINKLIHDGKSTIRQRLENVRQDPPKTWPGFEKVLRALPGWATTGHSSYRLNSKPGLFDLVVIDEAAQCPTPIVLGLLLRAKRALIIGDPHQIPPVTTLSESDDALLRRKHGLGKEWMRRRRLQYTDSSIYQACAATVDEVHLLDEHYRCDPQIVATPNRVIYQNQLAVLTPRSRLTAPAEPPAEPAVQVIDFKGKVEHPSSGSCRNPSEATRVIELVAELRSSHPNVAIGVVTPFRAHVRLLTAGLRKIDLHEVVKVGTAHSFQGDERDIIVLSPVGSEGIRAGSADWMVKQTNLWNVAITRAKSRLYVVCNREWWSRRSGLLTELFESPSDTLRHPGGVSTTDRLQAALDANGVNILARDELIAGQHCDLLLSGATTTHAVVIDGSTVEDGRAYRQLLAKNELISSDGYSVERVPAWRCVAEPQTVATELVDRIGRDVDTAARSR